VQRRRIPRGKGRDGMERGGEEMGNRLAACRTQISTIGGMRTNHDVGINFPQS
jgi:hypothetical protein